MVKVYLEAVPCIAQICQCRHVARHLLDRRAHHLVSTVAYTGWDEWLRKFLIAVIKSRVPGALGGHRLMYTL